MTKRITKHFTRDQRRDERRSAKPQDRLAVVAPLIGALLLSVAMLAGCGDGDDDGSDGSAALLSEIPAPFGESQLADTYIGEVTGTLYLVAVVTDGAQSAAGYLCNGTQDVWLSGTLQADVVQLRGESSADDVTLTLKITTGLGSVRLPGADAGAAFTVRPAGENEGVFRIDDENGLRGWIRYENELRGFLRRRRRGGGGSPAPTPGPTTPLPCAGLSETNGVANNPAACTASICNAMSHNFATATTEQERLDAEQNAALLGCILNPFVELNQP